MSKMETLPLPHNRKLFFAEQVDQKSIVELTKQILNINDHDAYLRKLYKLHGLKYKPDAIEIFIDSYGGYVYQVLGLVSVMETSTTPIHTYVTGAAMSCGFIILISGHERFAYKHSTPLYHQVSSWGHGTTKDLDDQLIETKRLQEKLERLTLEKTKITKKKLAEVYKTKIDWYMTAEEALKLGVVDSIIE